VQALVGVANVAIAGNECREGVVHRFVV